MNFNTRLNGFPLLTTPRLRLREINPELDAPARHAIWSDPRVMQFLPNHFSQSIEDSQNVLTWLHARFYDAHILSWAITLADSDELIGGLRYWGFSGHNFLIGEIGYELSPAHWGHRYMSEALTAATDFGFNRIGLNRIQLTTHPDNLASQRTAHHAGFLPEGLLHRWEFNGRTQQWEDRIMHYHLRPDEVHTPRWFI